jgi:putative intracellular protease/amidase
MRVLMPLPDRDFDVTEVVVPWRLAAEAGHEVVFATEAGAAGPPPAADPRLLAGVLFGRLGAAPEPVAWYGELTADPRLRAPERWADLDADDFDGLLLPGGHAPGMRQYLGSRILQEKVAAFWATGRPVGAICHGVLVLARAAERGADPDADPDSASDTGAARSVLAGRTTTCLPKYMERSAYLLTGWRLGRYYRTYRAYVQDEVVEALGPDGEFVRGPRTLTARGTHDDDAPAFVVVDGSYVSARWPGDAYLFAKTFLELLIR